MIYIITLYIILILIVLIKELLLWELRETIRHNQRMIDLYKKQSEALKQKIEIRYGNN